MKIIGLSGGIASGKNFIAEIFAKNGAAIFDADAEVHKMFEGDEALILKVGKAFPESLQEEEKNAQNIKMASVKNSFSKKENLSSQKFSRKIINRKILGKIVFSDAEKLLILEKIIHPIVRKKYDEFLRKSQQEKRKFVVLNIPLLLEKQGYKCDKIIAIIVPPSIQKRRFFARKKNESQQELEKKFKRIVKFQLSNKERKEKSDYVVNTRFSKAQTIKAVKEILQNL